MIPDSVIKERIALRAQSEGRADDTKDEVVANRIATYHAQTEPLIEYYTEKGKYYEVESLGSIEEVGEKICRLVEQIG